MRQKKLFLTSALFYIISSSSVLLMGVGDEKNEGSILSFIPSIIFWIFLIAAIATQLRLRKLQKPQRQRIPFLVMVLSPPTTFFEITFLISLLAIIVLSMLGITGFIQLFLLSLLLICFELTILSLGKFKLKDGKYILMIYKIRSRIRSY